MGVSSIVLVGGLFCGSVEVVWVGCFFVLFIFLICI